MSNDDLKNSANAKDSMSEAISEKSDTYEEMMRRRRNTSVRIEEILVIVFLWFFIIASLMSISEYSSRVDDIMDIDRQVAVVSEKLSAISDGGDEKKSLYLQKHDMEEKKHEIRGAQLHGEGGLVSNGTVESVEPNKANVQIGVGPFYYLRTSQFSSDILLSFIAVFCGGIGSVIAGLRKKDDFTALRDVILGLASGFVVYIVLRGGKYVFLLQQGEVTLNPYGFALSGLLTGLFTERAYGILILLIAALEKHLQKAIGEDQGDTPNPSEPGKKAE